MSAKYFKICLQCFSLVQLCIVSGFFFLAQNRKLHMHALFLNMLNVDLLHTLREDIVQFFFCDIVLKYVLICIIGI